jgi:hypothetical protein
MSYDVTINPIYFYGFTLNDNPHVYPPNQIVKFAGWGSNIINVPGMGPMNFIDIANTTLPQYTNPKLPWTNYTWGGLIRYRDVDVYFRYEGEGSVAVTLDLHGSVQVSFPVGDGMVVDLDAMSVDSSDGPTQPKRPRQPKPTLPKPKPQPKPKSPRRR